MWPFSSEEKAALDSGSPGDSREGVDSCPVDEGTRRAWLARSASSSPSSQDTNTTNTSSAYAFLNAKPETHDTVSSSSTGLSKERIISSIPRWSSSSSSSSSKSEEATTSSSASSTSEPLSSNWVYPSPNQFFSAMARKNHNPRAEDMNVVVPIHNAVNERAWGEILEWERMSDGTSWQSCGGPKLVSFKGRPKDITWKAWSRSLLGYQLPFDRHDWEVDRCGRRIKYVIDFYTGRSDGKRPSGLSFYLDVRPSPADLEGWRMRIVRIWKKTFS